MTERSFRPYELEEIISETVKRTLREIGLDTSDPIELQKDFAHVRAWREGSEQVKQKSIIIIIGTLITGTLGLIIASFRPH